LTGVWVVAETTGKRPESWKAALTEDPLDRLRHLAGVAGRGHPFWQENAAAKLQQLCAFLEKLAAALESFHESGLVWLTFHPHWLEDAGERFQVTNLDLTVHRIGRMPNRIRLVPSFAAPEVVRGQVAEIGPRTSVYQLALFTYYWLGRYLAQGFPGKGLESFGFVIPPLRIFAPTLPPGIAGIVAAGLALEPARRPSSPNTFCQDFRAGVERVAYRLCWHAPAPTPSPLGGEGRSSNLQSAICNLQWDVGLHTRAGRAKAASGGANQDYGFVRRFSDPDRALMVVADGLSCCDVGSGDVASRLVSEAIAAAFEAAGPDLQIPDSRLQIESPTDSSNLESPGSSSNLQSAICNLQSPRTGGKAVGGLGSDFASRISRACRQGAEAILAWALEHGERERLVAGSDLMATTVLAGWLEGNTLTLANAGDSRAYLINSDGIEQLTVDADLGCTLLAAGSPPESVVELGPVTRALRSCVGGVLYRSDTDELIVDEARCKLVVTRWQLLPGDVVILCSDGLVEEGAFLEPQELLELVRRHANLPAVELAEKLADAADARQQPPSPQEPDGFGDNITCCALRILRAG
jgi:serine/threonine protein phosphatase PrpC